MPTPMEQALITLVPTLNTLPPELLDLSASLLAQSRAKAATLKPDEEIGRVYACAHLAVDRLKHRLDIDKVIARPPVPPRVYKKLYGYLDAALAPSTPRTNRFKDVGTPGSRGKRSAAGTSLETPSKTPLSAAKDGLDTPSKTPLSAAKSAVSAGKETTASGKRTRAALRLQEEDPKDEEQKEGEENNKEEQGFPEQAQPIISALGTALDAPEAEPHISAALTAVLEIRGWNAQETTTSRGRKVFAETSASKRRRASSGAVPSSPPPPEEVEPNAITPESLPAVLTSMALIITFTLRNTIIDVTAYAAARSTAISALRDLSPSTILAETSIDSFLHASKQEGWLDLPWFTAVKAAAVGSAVPQTPRKDKRPAKTPLRRKEKHAPRPNGRFGLGDVIEEVEEDEDVLGAGLKWGLGTMFQDSIDWLSFERRKEYRIWQRDIRQKCENIEAEVVEMEMS